MNWKYNKGETIMKDIKKNVETFDQNKYIRTII